jgi:hypothetical protein
VSGAVSDWLEALQLAKERLDRAAGVAVFSPFSLDGADAVEGCIARAVAGELDATGELALGRYPPFPVPGAGAWLAEKGKYDARDPALREGLADAVRLTLAVGWVLASEGGEIVAGRDEADIYSVWALDYMAATTQAQAGIRRKLTRFGPEIFLERLRDGRLTGRLGARQLRQIGFLIAGGGFFLRVTQSVLMDDETFANFAEHGTRRIAEDSRGCGRWAWDGFGV